MTAPTSSIPTSRGLGIRARIIVPLAAVAITVSIMGVVSIHRAQSQQRHRQLLDRASTVMHAVAHMAETAAEREQLQRFVVSLTGESGVDVLVVVAGEPRTVIASSRPEWLSMPVDDVPRLRHERHCLVNARVTRQPRLDAQRREHGGTDQALPVGVLLPRETALTSIPGAVMLQLDARRVQQEQYADTAKLMATFLSAIGLSCCTAYALLWHVVIRPVGRIAEVTKATQAGCRNARIQWSRGDEFGWLSEQIDRMLDEIDRREAEEKAAWQQALAAQQEAETALAELSCFKSALDQHAIVAVTDKSGVITYANDRLCEISKHAREQLVGQTHCLIDSSHHAAAFWQEMWHTIRSGEVWQGEICNRARDGSRYWVDTTVVPFTDIAGQVTKYVAIGADITKRKTAEQELTLAARLDKLTGLPNRVLFLDRLQEAIQRSDRARKHAYAVMFLDFDRFKLVNDSLGHDVGDALLVAIAEKLRQQVSRVDSVGDHVPGHLSARLGGDEFVVLLDELQGGRDAAAMADALLGTFAQPHHVGKHEVYSTASIGIVVGDSSYERAEDVVRDADTAMYEAKRRGKGRYVVFDASMRERVQRHVRLENDLRRAIGDPQLKMHYQPIVSLRTGTLYGVEALLRWQHPVEGMLDPAEFVAIAEESDLILALGEWAFEESCRQMAAWQQALGAIAPQRICINLSRREFALPNLPQRIRRVVSATGVSPRQIQVEVTEDACVADMSQASDTMHAIKQLGIELALDGFGSGSSTFASLHQFPVDVLKIDRAMLTGIEDSKDVASLIHGLAVMVKNLGIDLVAEGVETAGQVIALQELGCDYAQGFFFAEALAADEMPAFAQRSLSLDCQTRGAVAYAHQWGDRLAVFESFDDLDSTTSR